MGTLDIQGVLELGGTGAGCAIHVVDDTASFVQLVVEHGSVQPDGVAAREADVGN